MRSLRFCVLVFAAACAGAESSGPIADDPFTGSYKLATVGPSTIPGTVYAQNALDGGGYGIISVGTLTFPDAGHVVLTAMWERHTTSSSPGVFTTEIDTFNLGRLPTEGFALRRATANDTAAIVTVPSVGRLNWNYRISNGLGTYVFAR